jgi:hypothetical protein
LFLLLYYGKNRIQLKGRFTLYVYFQISYGGKNNKYCLKYRYLAVKFFFGQKQDKMFYE